MQFLFTMLLITVILVGAVGFVITSLGEPTRRKRKAREIFFWMMIIPALLMVVAWIVLFFRRLGR